MSVATLAATSASPTEVDRIVSPSGIEIWHVESHVVPLVALAFMFEGGGAHDPADRGGAAMMMSALLDEGAGDLASDAFQERLAERAIEMSFNSGPDALGGSLKTLVRHADEAFDLLRLALTEPRFDADAIERVRGQMSASLRRQMNDPGVVASKRFFAEGFAGHPYGRPTSGSLESVARIGRDDLVAFHRAAMVRDRVKIAAVGAIDRARLVELVERAFGGLPATSTLSGVPATSVAGLGQRHVCDLDVPQSVIRFGMNGVSWRDPDFIPAYVLNHILGGGTFSSRLFQEVREKRGLAYSVGTSIVSYRGAAMTWGYTATKNERAAECLAVIESECARLRDEGPTDEELEKAKSYLIGSYALGFDSSTKIAHQLAQISFEGLGLDYIGRRNGLVAGVTQDRIRAAARRVFGDGKMLVVVAGRPVGL